MGVMDSLAVWIHAAGDAERGVAWRDATTTRMAGADAYIPYEQLVGDAAVDAGLDPDASARLLDAWTAIEPWPDAQALRRVALPYGFVTNCSARLAGIAAGRSGLRPRFTLSAEEAGRFKPRPEVYRLACRRLGTVAPRTLFVAGSPYDAAGAQDAGLPTVLVLRRSDHQSPRPEITTAGSLAELVDRLAGARKS
jgi:2-haloacid dehalogenase